MSTTSLTIKDWSAWMPGINSAADWKQWASGQRQPQEGCIPDVSNIPPMLRRRLSSLGKMAASVSLPLLAASSSSTTSTPCVFSSRHGELTRTVGLLNSLAQPEALSPTHFSLSVHNAIGGIMAITRKDSSSITALAGDLGAAFLEAAAILIEQDCEQILCVIYDEPVPAIYSHKNLGPSHPYAIAFLLANESMTTEKNDADNSQLTLSICELSDCVLTSNVQSHPSSIPQALTFLKYLLTTSASELLLPGDSHAWHWTKINRDSDAKSVK